jgi:hypothetical protein
MGIAFLSLQGDKYGYTPLPKTILQLDMDERLKNKECPEDVLKLIRSWYVLDDNALQKEYVLRNLGKTTSYLCCHEICPSLPRPA